MKHKLYYPIPGGAGECENCGKQNPDRDEDCGMSDKILYQWEAKGVKHRIANSSDGPVMQWQPVAGEWLTVLSGTFVKAFAHLAGRVEELEAVAEIASCCKCYDPSPDKVKDLPHDTGCVEYRERLRKVGYLND